MIKVKQAVALVAGLAAGVMVFAAVAAPAPAQADATQDKIDALMQEIAALKASMGGSSTASVVFTRDLTIGSTGADVTALQQFLIGKGHVIPAGATGYFGAQTKAALSAYQAANGIVPAAGYFGPITRAKVSAGTTTGGGNTDDGDDDSDTDTDTGDLEGGAGSVDSYKLMSGLTNEKVGEDAEDVDVAGLEIEVDNGSDIEITAVRLVFNEGTAGSDFDKYASEVAIMLDGKEAARVDADEFNSDNNWTKTVSLDNGAIIRGGDTENLTVAISGISNLDTNDAADTWTVDFTQIRFRDGAGDSTSEDPATGTRTFSFESFATATNAELRLVENDENINDAHVIDVHATDDTNDVPLLSFTMEARGTSDLKLNKLAASTTVTGASHVDDILKEVTLWIDGEEITSGTSIQDSDGVEVGTTEGYLFDDLDYTIDAGDKVEAEIRGSFNSVADALDEGDTVTVTIDEDTTDTPAAWDVDDETGERLGDADLIGTATGGAHPIYDNGIKVKFLSQSTSQSEGSIAGDKDVASLVVKFSVEALNGNSQYIYIDGDTVATATPSTDADGDASAVGFSWATTTDSTIGTTTAQITAILESDNGTQTGDTTTSGDKRFRITAGSTPRNFTFTVTVPAEGVNGIVGSKVTGLRWGTTDADAMANVYTYDLGNFKTSLVTGVSIH
ncbi:MAG: hypothetical protein A2571_01220 [Candidatus Vogelbacteria bacterium RIFOXYD1_FULL_44_32]|uniref:Peptidoglycan binding-like domain-containing protein n=1 Tax=Candidatus Vogelbacteria bacterium RIFOXYD1_FULL_44_32 TaxID=1802438 RepID=A0A1G2QEF6_9BACT|nr:MAG: hypothetical protein A2571_01220 [Candidatus Vogelbacteria bacterium RIFOXYD1_FULL_44_32]